MNIPGLDFRATPRPGGYLWWYVDAVSDDGHHALTLIVFIGSVFSPYYAAARRRTQGLAAPVAHCALNVALYGPRARWCMTERGSRALERAEDFIRLGPSMLRLEGDALIVDINEIAVPWPRRIRGTVRIDPEVITECVWPLDEHARHAWRAIAPRARITASFMQPELHWRGTGYLDSNHGQRPLEDDFPDWDWARAALPDGTSAVVYRVTGHDGEERIFGGRFLRGGAVERFDPPPARPLEDSRWKITRRACCDPDGPVKVVQSLEDGPFYARSRLAGRLLGKDVELVHETVSLERFSQRWVQALLPFRMPRRA